MKSKSFPDLLLSPATLLIFMLLALVLYTSPRISALEAEDEREFDHVEGSEKGPARWGDLKREWRACKTGRTQSPIDILSRRVLVILKTDIIERNYTPGNATIMNRGHDISVQWELGMAGSIKIKRTRYFLQQCHWHSPSEHSIDGRRYDMELHMVHVSPDPSVKNKIAVVSLLYKDGPPNGLISELTAHIRSLIDRKEERAAGVVDPRNIKMDGKKFYKYVGSLTTPPCTEGVTWIINKKLTTASRDQVELLREAVYGYAESNARPLQPLNGREIFLHVLTE